MPGNGIWRIGNDINPTTVRSGNLEPYDWTTILRWQAWEAGLEVLIKSIIWLAAFITASRLAKKQIQLPDYNEKLILFCLAAGYGVLYYFGLFFEQGSFNTYAKDLTIYLQALDSWRLYSPILGRSLLVDHFSPLLLVLVPLGKLFNYPGFLFLLQSLLLVLPVLPLHRIAKQAGLEPWARLLIIFVYLNFYYTRSLGLTDFHVELFAPLFMLMLVDAFLSHRRWALWGWLVACLMIKEDIGFYMAAWFALMAIGLKGERKRSLLLAAIAFAAGVLSLVILLPANQGGYQPFQNWANYGNGLFGIIVGMAAHPLQALGVLFRPALWKFYLPLLGLPLFTLWGWASLPALWVQLTSGNIMQQHLYTYYAAPVIPLTMVALIYAWRRWVTWIRLDNRRAPWLWGSALFLIVFNVHWLPWPALKPEYRQLSSLLTKLPGHGLVYAQADIAPHIGHSQRVRVLGMNSFEEKPDIIIFHLKGNIWPFSRNQYLQAMNRIKFNTHFKLWKDEAGAQIYIRQNQNP